MQQRTIALATVSGFASGLLVGYCLSRNGGARDHKESEEDFGRESQKETGEPSTPPVRFYKAGEDIDQVRAIVKRVVAHAKQVISGGITNMLFRAGFVGSMIDRSVENETFVNGRCEAFHDGYQACTLEDLRNPKLSSMIARELAKLHKLKLPSHISRLHSKVGLWDQMHSWLRSAKAHKKTVPLSLQPTPFATPLGTPIPTPKQSDIDEDDDIAGGGGEEEADNSDAHVKTKNSSDHKNISKRKETKFDYTIDLTAAGGDKEGQGSSVIGHSSSSEGKRTNQSDRSRSSLQPPSSSILPENVQGLEEEGEEKKNDNKKQQNSCNSCRLSADSIEQYCSIDLNRCAHLLKELQGMLDDSKKGRRGKGGKGGEMMTASTNNRHVVFCHNDLLCGNILKAPGNESVKLIDFEYGGLGYRGFDIANHFNEWAGGTLTAEEDAPGYNGVPDYSHFPTDRQQRSFCAAYLTEFNGGIAPSAVQLENLLSEVGRFVSLNHLYWGTWAINRAFEEGCDEFDYMRYATIRIMRGLLGDTEAM